ncbi:MULTISPECIES: tryptophan 2,3-dioxygenase [Halocynthiibacter]|uniref:Tryptophan 2,3-dioxygenase n=1 Tax=Halocynthiibacter halioticoli TaxID=2986804 RepID=A0AAE3IWJ2_9RHOB|nr:MULTISPECIES: tryptophan 2,3-dioxygenase family protein [Halocynthiibacter]MCV6823450.1 tryptophan 2,3-dioxygenase family protein [Halocynthiibacter halioticoli]MCW4056451.1 tryptophan 2,3-dioxygenase family protein [Halocynthiibacter sp. SDUM655004]
MSNPPKKDRILERGVEETLVTDFSEKKRSSYGDFLNLDTLLNIQDTFQDPAQPDELLFVIIHQASELWLKLMHHQIVVMRDHLRHDRFGPAIKNVARIKSIQKQLIASWETLLTMTPADYMLFRDALGNSSGFQSYGYRRIEFILGNKDRATMGVHKHDAAVTEMLEREIREPSVYDEVIRLLARQGFEVPEELLERDFSEPYGGDARIVAIWKEVYLNTDDHWDLYCLAEALMDIETLFQRWRFDHASAVERVIGMQHGTGGSSGVAFLKRALNLRFFHDLYDVRSELFYPKDQTPK